MRWIQDDGGRAEAGYLGSAGDCVTRSIAIATKKSYQEVYDSLNELRKSLRQTKRVRGSSARTGVNRVVYDKYLKAMGWEFVATMRIGSGCKVHLKEGELPIARLIARLSGHLVAVIDGDIHDTYDPSRNGTRCVYGYYRAVQS